MLERSHRLTNGQLFASTVRRGRRAGTSTLVVHLAIPRSASSSPPQVGLVVGKAVGKAVTRSLVKRRLRHLSREHLDELPGGAVLVIRALPASADAEYARLGADLSSAISRSLGDGGRS